MSDSEDETPPTSLKDVSSVVGTPVSATNPPTGAPAFPTKAGAKVEVASNARVKLSRFAFWPRDKSTERAALSSTVNREEGHRGQNSEEEGHRGQNSEEEESSAKPAVSSNNGDTVHRDEKEDAEDMSASEDEKFSDQEQEQRFEEEEEEDEEEEEEEGEEEVEYTSRKQNTVLHFINTCTEDEACSLPGNSSKKAILLLSLRPFWGWKDLVSNNMEAIC